MGDDFLFFVYFFNF